MSSNKEGRMNRPRGRPKRSDIGLLVLQGLKSKSLIKCGTCCRVFSRRKSLSAHISIHYNVKKYKCSYPYCEKSFKQSSQLTNHMYLHSKELPFKCPADDCQVRYAHSNRFCQSHPELKLIKQRETAEEIRSRFYQNVENLSENDKNWFEKHLAERERKPHQVLVKRRKNKIEDLQKIIKDNEMKSFEEKNMQQQKAFKDWEVLWKFLVEVHKNGKNSKALFEKSCNSRHCSKYVQLDL